MTPNLLNVPAEVLVNSSLDHANECDELFHKSVDKKGLFCVWDIFRSPEPGLITAAVHVTADSWAHTVDISFTNETTVGEAIEKAQQELEEYLTAMEDMNQDYLDTLPANLKREILKDEHYEE